jgi:hypothetical protein
VLQLFDFLKENLAENNIDKQKMADALLSDPSAEPRRVYHLNNYLLDAVEKFLAQERWEKQEHIRNASKLHLIRNLRLDE